MSLYKVSPIPVDHVQNLSSANLLDSSILHTGTFLDLSFSDNSFGLVTSSLAIHNVSTTDEKRCAIQECARVTKNVGWLLIIDLKGNVALYENTLPKLQWEFIERKWAGMKMMFGILPCEILKARKPQ